MPRGILTVTALAILVVSTASFQRSGTNPFQRISCSGFFECLTQKVFQDPEKRLYGRWKDIRSNFSIHFAPGGYVDTYIGDKHDAKGTWGSIRSWPTLGKIDIHVTLNRGEEKTSKSYFVEFSDNNSITMTGIVIAKTYGYRITGPKYSLTRIQ
ncbi:hypothetical protein [Martelella mangrovi]|uniref:Uncharacterized protein n=1 Tax=Martelella mangrovi TaxID=1397477 RepID=A0ABV2IEU5_9HYPH